MGTRLGSAEVGGKEAVEVGWNTRTKGSSRRKPIGAPHWIRWWTLGTDRLGSAEVGGKKAVEVGGGLGVEVDEGAVRPGAAVFVRDLLARGEPPAQCGQKSSLRPQLLPSV